MARTDTYDKARDYIAQFVVKHGKAPTVDELAMWFATEHDATPSRETLRRALNQYKSALNVAAPADASAVSLAQTMLAQARAEANAAAEKTLMAARSSIEREANARIAEIERAARVQTEHAELARVESERKALLADERANVIKEHAQQSLAEVGIRNESLVNALFAATAKITELASERDVAIRREADAIAEMQRLETSHAERVKSLEAQFEQVLRKSDEREERSAEQFRSSQSIWLNEVAALRDRIPALEKALLAARVEKDEAVTQTRRDMSEAIAAQLKELSVSVGGVNQVHNLHMGAIQDQLKTTISQLNGLSTLFHTKGKTTDSVLPAQPARKERK